MGLYIASHLLIPDTSLHAVLYRGSIISLVLVGNDRPHTDKKAIEMWCIGPKDPRRCSWSSCFLWIATATYCLELSPKIS